MSDVVHLELAAEDPESVMLLFDTIGAHFSFQPSERGLSYREILASVGKNAASVVGAAQGWKAHLDQGGRMLVTLAGAMSTAELGISRRTVETQTLESGRDQGVVVRPDRAVVVGHRVVARLAAGNGGPDLAGALLPRLLSVLLLVRHGRPLFVPT